jgi:sugar phosphate isomerase/epimerase
MHEDQIALQLYTVRELLAHDMPGTLRAVADSGYRFVEVAGVPEARTGELPTLLRDAGLQAIAVHVGIQALQRDPDGVAGRLADLGADHLIVPVMPDEDRLTPADVTRFADELTRFAPILAGRGIRLGYHNHAFEFRDIGGTTTWDVLVDRLAPEVELEIDVYWAKVGGRDPVTLIESVADRVRLLHMKDLVSDPDPQDAPAGQGSLDFPAITAAGRAAGVEWYIAEQDDPRAALEDIASAYAYLASIAD